MKEKLADMTPYGGSLDVPVSCRHEWFMVFNATFNNISVILWQLVLLVEETGVPRENH